MDDNFIYVRWKNLIHPNQKIDVDEKPFLGKASAR